MDGREREIELSENTLPDDDEGLSLEELSRTYARLMGADEVTQPVDGPEIVPVAQGNAAENYDALQDELIESDECPITPLSILEAILFIGQPNNAPIQPETVSGLMRGVHVDEIGTLAEELNRIYVRDGHALRIQVSGGSLRMVLDDELEEIRQRFYGKVRETKLSQAAIDCLALIAYQPGVTREKIEQQRGEPSGSILNQLVRRELIEIRHS